MDTIITLGKIAGIGGIALGIFVVLFRDFIRKNIFPRLRPDEAYKILRLFLVLIWSLALAGLAVWFITDMQIRANEAKRNDPIPVPTPAPAPQPAPTPARFYRLCIGEKQSECVRRYGTFDEHIGCSDPRAWANVRCSNNPIPNVFNNQGGNRCGYALADFICAPK